MDLEMNFLVYLSFSVFLAVILAIFLTHYRSGKDKTKKKVPPGQMGIPWIGETIDFCKALRKNRLFEDFVEPRIQKYGKTFKTRLMGSPTVVVNGAEANKFFLSNEFKLVISSWPTSSVQLMGKDSIMEKQGEAHRCLRGIVATSLNSTGLDALVPKICKTVEAHMEKYWHGREKLGLYHLTKVLTFTIVLECLFGIEVKPGMLETFERVLEGVFAFPVTFPGSKFSSAKRARGEIKEMLGDIIRKNRDEMENQIEGEGEGEGILLSRLVAALIRGEITEAEVIDNVVLLVFAAHDTTSFAIAMTFRMLGHHPNCYSTLLQEHDIVLRSKRPNEVLTYEDTKKMKYTWQVACESMRIFPPIFGSFRKAIDDIEYDGYTIPKGWKVLWTTYGTHYDEEYFHDPLAFDPGRFDEPVQPYAFLPFGGGPRLCAGYQLAKLNILIFVHYVVTRYDWSLISPEEPIAIDPLPFPSQGMPIKISPKLA
ncbi:taxadiene 5-alpha hydroxylase [Olea europaea var. sylvestris]|uniref:taxadiene 5-alpha hydroxylase n=1 Tax=Olea europaea var. sylvestris TaxID=158386 RepID=UPI000C1D7E25|nr:taxadiene 5-alpha hydroxylase [Olea europaea var. sylvestris]